MERNKRPMSNPAPSEKNVFRFNEKHIKAIAQFFVDLTTLYDHDIDSFRDLFCNREALYNKFKTLLQSADVSVRNKDFILIGGAGVGKTSFIYMFACDSELIKKLKVVPIVVDYRKALPRTVDGCLVRFVKDAEENFKKVGKPINTLVENTPENITQNLQAINTHIECLGVGTGPVRAVIVLDDFDYAEDTWFDLLDYFVPFATNPRVSLILTVRLQLYNDIQAYDDRFSYWYTRNVNTIALPNLEVREVLTSRLAPLLKAKGSSIIGFITSLFKQKTVFSRLLKDVEIEKLSELGEFDYPLTESHNNFMSLITNGNFREIFDIAYESLSYVLRHYNELETRAEEGIERRIIGHEQTLELLYDNPNSRYRVIDINKYMSKTGNSLLFNVLEGVKRFRTIDNTKFYPTLQRFGHSRKDVDWAIPFLSNKVNRFIEPKTLLPENKRVALYLYDEYEITEKGNLYLRMSEWPEYQRRCRHYGKSLFEGAFL
jgi:hypothetical protein